MNIYSVLGLYLLLYHLMMKEFVTRISYEVDITFCWSNGDTMTTSGQLWRLVWLIFDFKLSCHSLWERHHVILEACIGIRNSIVHILGSQVSSIDTVFDDVGDREFESRWYQCFRKNWVCLKFPWRRNSLLIVS